MNTRLVKIVVGGLIALTGTLGAYYSINSSTNGNNAPSTTTVVNATSTSNITLKTSDVKLKPTKVANIVAEAGQVVVLDSEIFFESVNQTIKILEKIKSEGYDEAWLLIDSPGGSIIDGNRLIAYMKGSGLKVNTVCTAICASMAFHTHQVGYKRYMQERSILMSHHASGGIQGDFEHMRSFLTFLLNYVDRMDAEVVARVGTTMPEYKALIENDYWLESSEALEKNYTDAIGYVTVENKKENPYVLSNILRELNVQARPKSTRGNVVFEFESYSGTSLK